MSPDRASFFVSLCVIIALFTLGISPACMFLSGQAGGIEICAEDGWQRVVYPANGAPERRTADAQNTCGFCFLSGTFASLDAGHAVFDYPDSYQYPVQAAFGLIITPRHYGDSPPRAPPFS